VAVRGWGPTGSEAFAQTAAGLLSLAVVPGSVREQDSREVRAQGDSPEALLMNWVNECLYVHEIEGWAVARIEILIFEERRVHALLHGEEIDSTRHRVDVVARAREAEVTKRGDRVEARVILAS
jgi:SHS2 domain-containing protein